MEKGNIIYVFDKRKQLDDYKIEQKTEGRALTNLQHVKAKCQRVKEITTTNPIKEGNLSSL